MNATAKILKCPAADMVNVSYIVGRRGSGKSYFVNRVLTDKRIYGEHFSDIVLYTNTYEHDKYLYSGVITHLFSHLTTKNLKAGFKTLKNVYEENSKNQTCMVIENFKAHRDIDIVCELTNIISLCRRYNIHVLITAENIKYLHHFDFGVSHLVISNTNISPQTRHVLLTKYSLCKEMKKYLRNKIESKIKLHEHIVISFDTSKICIYNTKTLEIKKESF